MIALSSPEERSQGTVFGDVAEALARAGISFRFKALGHSMYPTIRNGEMIHVAPLGRHQLRRGDIVLVQQNGKIRAHRIIQIKGEWLITRGDSSPQADNMAGKKEIVGLVVAKECLVAGRRVSLVGTTARGRFHLRRLRANIAGLLRMRSARNVAQSR